jgi:hypothetical protein
VTESYETYVSARMLRAPQVGGGSPPVAETPSIRTDSVDPDTHFLVRVRGKGIPKESEVGEGGT